MMHQVYTLPDDRPIRSIGVVEDPEKCPPDYYVVSRTHDQDSDADLWKDGFFGRKVSRYLCLSKTTGLPDYFVESIAVVHEKETPPDGFTLLPRTIDTEQKAWRKRQLCYRLTRRSLAKTTITDVIILSRMKKAPEGFLAAGEINGLTLCFKTGPSPDECETKPNPFQNSQLAYSLSPLIAPLPSPVPRKTSVNGNAHVLPQSPCIEDLGDDYVCLRPTRQAPAPPLPSPLHSPALPFPKVPSNNLSKAASFSRNYATLAAFQGLEGVPFSLGPRLKTLADPSSVQLPNVRQWNEYQLETEFQYDFRTERLAQVPNPSEWMSES